MALRIVQVDAFTSEPFAGNPAAVCVLKEAAPEPWMRAVAREMNLSETAFLHPQGDGYALRWFTPSVEVDLCGHATLASAHVLWEDGHLAPSKLARFETRSGQLTAERVDRGIELDFPATTATPIDPPPGLLESLGVTPRFLGKTRFDYLIELGSEEEVRAVRPDFSSLRSIGVRGVMVTAPGSGSFDFVSRFFAPGSGIDEDPVTGSAHCALAPYWSRRLGKETMVAFQASERGGVLRLRVAGDRVRLGGDAVTVLRGELLA